MKLLKKSLLFLMVGSLISCGAQSPESKEINKCYKNINNDILSHRCKVEYYFQNPEDLSYHLQYEVSFDDTKMMLSMNGEDTFAELIDGNLYCYKRFNSYEPTWSECIDEPEYYWIFGFWGVIAKKGYYCIDNIFSYISSCLGEAEFQPFMKILNSNKKTAKIEDGNLVIPYITLVDIEDLNWYWHLENLNVTFKDEHIDTFSFYSYQNREHELIHSIKLSNVGTNVVERPDDLVIE